MVGCGELEGAVVGDVLDCAAARDVLGCGGAGSVLRCGAFRTLLPPQVLHTPLKYSGDEPASAVGYCPERPKGV